MEKEDEKEDKTKKTKDKDVEKEKEDKAQKRALYIQTQLSQAKLCNGNVWTSSLKPGSNVRPVIPETCQLIKNSILHSGWSTLSHIVVHENTIYNVDLGRRRCSKSKRTADY